MASLSETINKMLDVKLPAFPQVPSVILSLGSIGRSGLSPMKIAQKIIERQQEVGVPIGPAADGSENMAQAMELIRVEEIVKALKYESQVQVSIPTGAITIIGTGTDATGTPVTITGFNINFIKATGVIA